MNDNGIIYLNSGKKMLPRLLVSVYSLRKVYNGNISIIQIGDDGLDIINKISDKFNCQIIYSKQELNIKHHYWFEKSRTHLYTPYANTIFIDSDTLIINNIYELFDEIQQNDFIVPQFSNWICSGKRISKRLKSWNHIDKDLVKKTIESKMPSINVGVYGFKKISELMRHWFDFTIQNPNSPLPEEISCHLLLQKYKGKIISNKYNCSCKHDNPKLDDVKIIHYHGRKHCRFKNGQPLFNSDLWIKSWKEIFAFNLSNIQNWYKDCGDTLLNRSLESINNYV